MPEFREITEEARRLLGKFGVERTLDYLTSHIKDYPAELKDIAFLKDKYEKLERKNTLGKIDYRHYSIENNRITHSIVKMISKEYDSHAGEASKSSQVIQEAQRLLEKKNLTKVLGFLSSELKGDPEVENTLILLYARWNAAQTNKRKGVIDKKQFKITKKQIKEAIAAIIEDIQPGDMSAVKTESPFVKSSKKSKKRENTVLLKFILLLQIAIIMGIAYIIFHLPG